jgi:hypothetical protein
MMNNLITDISYRIRPKFKEELSGDVIKVIQKENNETIIVLADGLGSGVKANILATLTTQVLTTMLKENMSIEEATQMLADTLPVCSLRKVAYSTFTIIQIHQDFTCDIYEYDNPKSLYYQKHCPVELVTSKRLISDKRIYYTRIKLHEGDTLLAFSDGIVHAGVGKTLNFGWTRNEIQVYAKRLIDLNVSSNGITSALMYKTGKLYEQEPGDDCSVVCVQVKPRVPVLVMVGPPKDKNHDRQFLDLFFSKKGKRVVCGGTTANLVSDYLHQEIKVDLFSNDSAIPPMAWIEGIDVVTEGVITINKVLEYAKEATGENTDVKKRFKGKDGASILANLLFEESTDIHFFIGQAVNPAHQNPDLPIGFHIKMQLLTQLIEHLRKMGKTIQTTYY